MHFQLPPTKNFLFEEARPRERMHPNTAISDSGVTRKRSVPREVESDVAHLSDERPLLSSVPEKAKLSVSLPIKRNKKLKLPRMPR